jgi:uncharacterized repeat protein (TIGR03803 family)
MRNTFLRSIEVVALVVVLSSQLRAQTFTSLYSFYGGSDGAYPHGDLALSGATLYGTTTWGYGTVFAVNVDGTGFTTVYSFTDGSDGARPYGGVMMSSNRLYATAGNGGNPDAGTVFAVSTDGTDFTALYDFSAPNITTNTDGAGPHPGLILSGNTLYGVTTTGGVSGNGTVFRINRDGSGFTTLHTFMGSDGSDLWTELVLSGNTLYGTTSKGGPWGNGTVFALNTDGTGFTNIYSFTAAVGSSDYPPNSDGISPSAMILVSDRLYGTASGGGPWGYGIVFGLDKDGTGFKVLHSFTKLGSALPGQPFGTNVDGVGPQAGLIAAGNELYGTTVSGGTAGNGTVFCLKTDGTGFTTLYNFSARSPFPCPCTNADGSAPEAPLILSGNTLYGTTFGGGASGYGTVFSLSLPVVPPQLTIVPRPGSVVLTWPTNGTGFTLQSSTQLMAQAPWTIVSPSPVVVNGMNTVTNPISAAQQFYRLSQ